jgi:hypothetical protein
MHFFRALWFETYDDIAGYQREYKILRHDETAGLTLYERLLLERREQAPKK